MKPTPLFIVTATLLVATYIAYATFAAVVVLKYVDDEPAVGAPLILIPLFTVTVFVTECIWGGGE